MREKINHDGQTRPVFVQLQGTVKFGQSGHFGHFAQRVGIVGQIEGDFVSPTTATHPTHAGVTNDAQVLKREQKQKATEGQVGKPNVWHGGQ